MIANFWVRYRSGIKRLVENSVVVFFLAVTLNGFLLTVWRISLDFVPRWPTYLSYSAMAPYQGGGPGNLALAAEGEVPNGMWQEIDLVPYYPLARGRHDVRMLQIGWLRLASGPSMAADDSYLRKFKALARRLQQHEAERGRSFSRIRLWWDEWPSSQWGLDARYEERKRIPLVTWP
jgi:hypothetical protein